MNPPIGFAPEDLKWGPPGPSLASKSRPSLGFQALLQEEELLRFVHDGAVAFVSVIGCKQWCITRPNAPQLVTDWSLMSQWWVLFVLGSGVGLACQIVFPVWRLEAKWLAAPLWDLGHAKSFISGVWKGGASLLMSAILGVVVLMILVSGSL
jgi:hypothetical protein